MRRRRSLLGKVVVKAGVAPATVRLSGECSAIRELHDHKNARHCTEREIRLLLYLLSP